jgi:hypothetical protein
VIRRPAGVQFGRGSSNVTRVSPRYQDAGFFNKWVAATAERNSKSAQAVKNDWFAGTPQLATGLLGSTPSSVKLSAALAAFIANPATLTISASGNVPIKVSDFQQMLLPALLSRVTLDAAVTK